MIRRLSQILLGAATCFPGISHAAVTDAQGEPLPTAIAIARLLAKDQFSANSRPKLAPLCAWGQRALLRPAGEERLSHAALAHYHRLVAPLSEPQRVQLRDLFQELGDVDAVQPTPGVYDVILVHGSRVDIMRRRIFSLAQAVSRGDVRTTAVSQVVFLEGERSLQPHETKMLHNAGDMPVRKDWQPPSDLPTDERQAARWVWEQMELPQALRQLPVTYVGAIKKAGSTRAHTDDTVATWLKVYQPEAKKCLMVSDNPFVEYQRLATEVGLMGSGRGCASLTAMGPPAPLGAYPLEVALGVMLDNFARTLYLAQQKFSARIF